MLARLLFLICLTGCPLLFAQTVRYPAIASADDPRSEYPLQLLKLALAQVDGDYQLQSSPNIVSRSRALTLLKEEAEVDVVWTMTSIEREQQLLAIRIPIFKGFEGYRLLLIKEESQAKFATTTSAEKIRRLVYAQGHDWIDADILRANGFSVIGSSQYELLFSMLEKGRVDAIPRNALEIIAEARLLASRNIVLEQNWLLYYPAASYFFVNKKNTSLAADIEKGLHKLLKSGRFDLLFEQAFEGKLKELKLDQRRLLKLHNPMLPVTTPLEDTRLWYYPDAKE